MIIMPSNYKKKQHFWGVGGMHNEMFNEWFEPESTRWNKTHNKITVLMKSV